MEIVADAVAHPPVTERPHDSAQGKRLELRCSICGFGAIVVRAPDRCPMCGASEWLIK
jgi:rubrerythrin